VHRGERAVGIGEPVGVALDPPLDGEDPPDDPDQLDVLDEEAPGKTRIERQRGLARQFGPALVRMLEAEQAGSAFSGVAATVAGDKIECEVEGVGKLSVTIGPPSK
jgi:hypothetical protein